MAKTSLPSAVVAAVAFLAYANNLGNDFVYDARYLVELDERVESIDLPALATTSYWGGLRDAGLYRPVTMVSYGLNRALSPSPWGFHLVNDLLHALASVLVLWTARALGARPWAAFASGLLFAMHPALSEAVTSVVGRAELLAFVFTIGALLVFVRGGSPLAAGVLAFLGLCSKESAAFALPLFVIHPLLFGRKLVLGRFASLAGAFALYVVLRFAVLGGFGIEGREIGLLDNPAAQSSLSTRLLTAFVLFARYVRLVLWPRALSADYSFQQIPVADELDPRVALGVLLAAAVVAGALAAWRRDRPLLAFGAAAFVVPLLGSLHLLFPLGTLFAERLLYLPTFGAVLVGARALEAVRERRARIGTSLLVILVALGSARTFARNRDWRDNETLFRKTVETSPESARAHFLLGAELLERGRFGASGDAFERGLRILPHHFGARMSLGQARLAEGRAEEAAGAFERALELAPGSEEARRGAVETHIEAGRLGAREGELEAARASFERALELDPRSAAALNYLGLVAERQGRFEEAASLYDGALESEPQFPEAAVNLASVRMRAGELTEAEALYRGAIALAPESYEAYNGLGIALARQGRLEEAEQAFRRAIELDPELPAARENLRALEGTR